MYHFLRNCLLALAYSIFLPTFGQYQRILCPHLATLQVVAGNRWTSMPVIGLHDLEKINISFDDMTHEYHRYSYTITHMEADWTPSRELFISDYVDGFAEGNTIVPIGESINTNTDYTHYHLSIPNDRCRLKISGNYQVTIYDDDSRTPVARACFMVMEPKMDVQLHVTTNTDIDINKQHQQIEMQLNYDQMNVANPSVQIKTVLLQNGRWDNARYNIQPQYIMSKGLRWLHNKAYIFDGGNEFRKFETLDLNHTTMGLEALTWDGKQYHAWTWIDEPRPEYVYDESAKGSFYIRNSDNRHNDTESDYLWIHFRLRTTPTTSPIYIQGTWTQNVFSSPFQLSYKEATGCYEDSIFLKQGYYSYQYLTTDNFGNYIPVKTEGNFYQTANRYEVLIYYRGIGQRTDELVAYQLLQYTPNH